MLTILYHKAWEMEDPYGGLADATGINHLNLDLRLSSPVSNGDNSEKKAFSLVVYLLMYLLLKSSYSLTWESPLILYQTLNISSY